MDEGYESLEISEGLRPRMLNCSELHENELIQIEDLEGQWIYVVKSIQKRKPNITFKSVDIDQAPHHSCLTVRVKQCEEWMDTSKRIPDAIIRIVIWFAARPQGVFASVTLRIFGISI